MTNIVGPIQLIASPNQFGLRIFNKTNKVKAKAIAIAIAITKVNKRVVKLIIVCIMYKKRAVVFSGNIREPDGECLVIDCFDIIFMGNEINQWHVVYAKYLEAGITTVAEMEMVANIVN